MKITQKKTCHKHYFKAQNNIPAQVKPETFPV